MGIELEVLFDAALNGGRLDWADVILKMDGQGPLLFVARTDKGYVLLQHASDCLTCEATCLAGSASLHIAETLTG
jgi:hypothetical protein